MYLEGSVPDRCNKGECTRRGVYLTGVIKVSVPDRCNKGECTRRGVYLTGVIKVSVPGGECT